MGLLAFEIEEGAAVECRWLLEARKGKEMYLPCAEGLLHGFTWGTRGCSRSAGPGMMVLWWLGPRAQEQHSLAMVGQRPTAPRPITAWQQCIPGGGILRTCWNPGGRFQSSESLALAMNGRSQELEPQGGIRAAEVHPGNGSESMTWDPV